MSLEKKLGLTFVGMLFLVFCGVLAMRLTTPNEGQPIDINVAGLAQPPANPTTNPVSPAAPTPQNLANAMPAAPGFANKPTFVAEQRPQQTPAGFANTGRATSPGATTTTSPSPDSASPYGATPSAPASARMSPPTTGFASSTPPPATSTSTPASSGNRYGATDPYGSPRTTPQPAGYAAPSVASTPQPMAGGAPGFNSGSAPTSASAPAVASSGNPLRSTTPAVSASAPPSMPMPTAATTSINPPTASSPLAAGSAPDTGRYASPNFGASAATATSPMTTSAPPTMATTREPRPFEASPSAMQPLATSSTSPGSASVTSSSPGIAALAPPAASATIARPQAGAAFATSPPSAPATIAMPSAPMGGAVAPASATMPVSSGRDQPYVVAPGDTLFSIAQKVYGDGSLYRALFAYNSDRYPHAEDIRSGNVLDVPPAEFLKQRYPDLLGATEASAAPTSRAAAPGGTYTVREGDTLFDIARKQLGQASRWTELYEANRALLGENLENLRPGVTLRLP
ncbi:MAG: LysM peptidoglycan-binding domain-containing protein [Pirellulales bacterium]